MFVSRLILFMITLPFFHFLFTFIASPRVVEWEGGGGELCWVNVIMISLK